ncbi:MAG: tRNA uridine-5-carboxymethylaminomethyl(34) synthesis GTPase MnmE [Chloroflexota bacterium]
MSAGATGDCAIGVVRLSGPEAIHIARALFRRTTGKPRSRWQSRRLYHGLVVDPVTAAAVDEVLLSVMRAPRSYTGQDVVELSCHGGVAVREVLRLALAEGARTAERGELTLRAYLAGKLDLAQAEAVADAVAARTPAALSLAVSQMSGALSERVRALRQALLPIYAHLEASVDFDEDDIAPIDRESAVMQLTSVGERLDGVLATARWGRLVRDGIKVALVGRPNAGKSSLLNALLQQDRAIVTPFPGTTRDVIEESIDLFGVPAVLADTAGIVDSNDPVERLGVERSRRAIDAADVLVLTLDGSLPLTEQDRAVAALARRPTVIALNKADLPVRVTEPDAAGLVTDAKVVSVSALTGQGMDALRTALADAGGWQSERSGETPGVVTSARHRDTLGRARQSLADAIAALEEGVAIDAVSTDVRNALSTLGEITGETVTEDVLTEIFSRFCIGK